MSRPLRIQYPHAVYHVMNRGAARQRVFRGDEDRNRFLAVVAEAHRLWGIQVYAYCLMDTHYHLCLRTPEGNLSRVMRHLDGLYTQRFNRAHHRDGRVFRGRYQALVIDAEAYLAAVVRYIHLNPVEGGLAKVPQAYPWCSHRDYLAPRRAPAWLEVQEVLSRYRGPRDFHQFVLAGNEKTLTAYYQARRRAPVLGDDRFKAQLEPQRPGRLEAHPRYERRAVRPSLERIKAAVAQSYGVPLGRLETSRRGVPHEARKMALLLAKEAGDCTLEELARAFGVSPSTVGWACSVLRRERAKSAGVAKRYRQIMATIQQNT